MKKTEQTAKGMTVHQVSRLSGISVRTLQYYDSIGLLKPSEYTEAGYRLYDGPALEKLQQILLLRELDFSLKDIKDILSSPNFDKNKALDQQIELLTLRKEHLENMIEHARRLKAAGGTNMDFKAFDTKKIDEYAKQAKEQWGKSPEYKEFEEKSKSWAEGEEKTFAADMAKLFEYFGRLKTEDAGSEEAQALVKKLQDYITEHFYNCTPRILKELGKMYAAGGDFTENIDGAGGEGTAAFVKKAIDIYCEKQ